MSSAHRQIRLREARTLTDELFGMVRPDALYDRPIAERHRLIFYLGHLEAFDWNLAGAGPLHPELDRLFAFGIDPTDGKLPDDRPRDWPRPDAVRAYAARARESFDAALEAGGIDAERFEVALEHRLMHAETLAYALNRMPLSSKLPGPAGGPARDQDPGDSTRMPHSGGPVEDPHPRVASGAPRSGRPVVIPEGHATLGRPRNSGFGWDNEYDEHQVRVPAFAIDRHDVTNRDYLAFVEAGGYRERSLWTREAWEWIRGEGIEHPAFWKRADGRAGAWLWRGMFEEILLPADWPVYVSHAEASAFAWFYGKKLPTEAQYHRAAFGAPAGPERAHPWGDEPPGSAHGNSGMRRWDPVPAGSHPAGDSAFGVADLAGNGWEWTRTPFAPFNGFTPHPFYPGYSADFFPRPGPNGIHYVMKGGSARTHAGLLRRSFRNWFQPLYPHVFASFRLVED